MSEPRWLNERESTAWRGYRQMRDLLDRQISRDLFADSGLSEADYTVLVVLVEAPEHRIRLIELAEKALWSKSRLSHQLTRMERRGLVRREECEQASVNTRAVDAVLTTEGRRVMKEAAPKHIESVRQHFVDPLTDDQIDAFADATTAIIRHLRAQA